MSQIAFLVQGSEPQPYTVTFALNGRNLNAGCTCRAGQVGQYCKHRFGILSGQTEGIVSDNADQVDLVVAMLKGTDVQAALQLLAQAEEAVESAKAALGYAKKALADAMKR